MMLKKKHIQAIIVLIVAAILALTGTFAWYSFNQRRINVFELTTKPGVNLHDDFEGGPDKDVYVENSGAVGLYVRVRLTEYMETVNRTSLLAGHSRGTGEGENETDIARMQWSPHSGTNHAESCTIRDTDSISSSWSQSDNFHNYYVWTMGGQKHYMPALIQHPDTALSDEPEVCVDTEIYTGTEQDVKQTLPAFVITMEQWLNGGYIKPDGEAMLPKESGEFWVVDTDGWCYWAQMLNPNEATGLLIDKVERTSKQFDSDVEYCINVWLQAVDIADIDTGVLSADSSGGITHNGGLLLQVLANGALIASDGSIYENNDDGTFVTVINKDGNTVEELKSFVPLGNFAADTTIAAAEKAGVPEEQRLYIGDKVNITDLIWDGEKYTNYGDWTIDDAPFYNITTDESGAYTVIGTEIGADKEIYLRLEDVDGRSLYLASVLAKSTFAPESPVSYVQGYPGTGPFGRIWPGDEGIGSKNDERSDPDNPIEKRYFRHIGNGVYIQVADENGEEAIDAPNTTYYFSSKIFGDDPYEVNNLDGRSVDAQVEAIFSFTLHIGENFGVYDDKDNGYSVILKGAEMLEALANEDIQTKFTMVELYEFEGNLYIDLNQEGYTNLYLAGMGENGEFGGQHSGELAEVVEGEMKPTIVADKAVGDGSPENPFTIRSRNEMNWLTREVMNGNTFEGKYLEVVRDFSMGDKDFLPVGSLENQFMGAFDGANHTISDLKVTASANYGGLFGYIGTGGTVENIKLKDVTVDVYGASVGGLAGRNEGALKNCHITSGFVTVNGSNVGGIAGYNTGTVESCTNAAKVKGNNPTGGIAGQNSGMVKDCENSGDVENKSGSNTGGVVGHNGFNTITTATVINSKNTGKIDGGNYTGGIAGSTYGDVTGCENSGQVSGGQIVGGIAGIAHANIKVDNCKNLSSGAVTGTAAHVGGVVGHNSGTVSYCENGGAVKGTTCIGGVVGNNMSTGKIENSKNLLGAAVTGTGNYVGGVAGNNDGTVTACENNATVNGASYAGGVAGFTNASGAISGSTNTAAVSGSRYTGGIVGSNAGIVNENSKNTGSVTCTLASSNEIGGVAGANSGTINSCSNEGIVTAGGNNAGGVAGFNSATGTVSNCTNSKAVNGTRYTGGIVGNNLGTVNNNCRNTGSVTCESPNSNEIGGVVGSNVGTIDGCSNAGSVKGSGNHTGGVAGVNTGTIIRCENSVQVNGVRYVGGVVGSSTEGARVEDSKNLSGGKVTGTSNETGGVAGANSGTVIGCENIAAVNGAANVGGVVGNNSGAVENCKNLAGSIVTSTAGNNGGIVGASSGTVTNCENRGTVTGGTVNMGGVVGFASNGSIVKQCTNYGNVNASSSNQVGGVVGQLQGQVKDGSSVTNSVNTGMVTGNTHVGGVAGYSNHGIVISCQNSGGIVTGTEAVGGVLGTNYTTDTTVRTSFSTGAVNGTAVGNKIGGIVGNNAGTIENSYAWGNVTGAGNQVGGVSGYSNGSITRCYHAKGKVSGISEVGGVVGHLAGLVQLSLAYGSEVQATGSTYYNKIYGNASGFLETLRCYYSNTLALKPNASGNGGWAGNSDLTNTQAAWSNAAYVGFNFTTVWRWDSTNNLPVLRDVTP